MQHRGQQLAVLGAVGSTGLDTGVAAVHQTGQQAAIEQQIAPIRLAIGFFQQLAAPAHRNAFVERRLEFGWQQCLGLIQQLLGGLDLRGRQALGVEFEVQGGLGPTEGQAGREASQPLPQPAGAVLHSARMA